MLDFAFDPNCTSREEQIIDMLANLLHLCDVKLDFDDMLNEARAHYESEK